MAALRVATFNLRHGRGLDERVDLERTAATIEALGASMIGMQEVDRRLPRSGRVDQPARLADLTGLSVSFFATLGGRGAEYGLAVASDGPLEGRLHVLPRVGGEEPRGVIVSRWRETWVLVTHLSDRPGARIAQTVALGRIAGELAGPKILMGDLNQTRRHLGPLRAAGLEGGPDRHASKPGRWRRKQIDFVLAGGGLRVQRSWAVRTDASDHLPVVAEIEPI
ncbi:MAG: endonuclease/exonuclease/phosphatase family protein [Actinomycetota bacterium]